MATSTTLWKIVSVKIESWDDLKFVLAVARAGNLTRAGRVLGVDQTTVSRRLSALEERSGVVFFERLRGGVELTAAGEALLDAGLAVEGELLELEHRLASGDLELTGSVRLACPELLAWVWHERLAAFGDAHPGLLLELVLGEEFVSLARRDADVALRVTQAPPEHLVGRRYGLIATAIYASVEAPADPLATWPWIGWSSRVLQSSLVEEERQRHAPDSIYALMVDNFGLLAQTLRIGRGLSVLPCIVGDRDPALRRLTAPRVMPQEVWLLTHPDLRRTPRVAALIEHLSALIEAERDALVGDDGR